MNHACLFISKLSRCAYTRTYVSLDVELSIYVYTYTYVYTCIHMYMHTHTHTKYTTRTEYLIVMQLDSCVCAGAENAIVIEIHQCDDNSIWRLDSRISDSSEKYRDKFHSEFRLWVASGKDQRCIPDSFGHAHSSFTEEVSFFYHANYSANKIFHLKFSTTHTF